MSEIVLLVPLRDEADAALFSGIDGIGVEPSREDVRKLSGVEIAVSLILSIGGSVAYDAGKAAVKSLSSRLRDYFRTDEQSDVEAIASFKGLQYDVGDPEELESLIADLQAVAEARDANAKQGD